VQKKRLRLLSRLFTLASIWQEPSDTISHFHALKSSIALLRGVSLPRWSRGLSVMLEKEFGNNLLSKLRAILLMEADFNTANKIIFGFGERMLLESTGLCL
jgi:hypothetical protein